MASERATLKASPGSPPPMINTMSDGSRKASCEPRFFKVLLPDFSTQLKLPRTFVKKHIPAAEDEKCRIAALSGPDGKTWKVGLHKNQQGTYISGDKWHACVQALNLKVGYILLFSYDGYMLFSFKVFDLSACEKAYRQIRQIPQSTMTHVAKKIKACDDLHHLKIVCKNSGHITSYCKDCKCTRLEACVFRTNLLRKYMEIPSKFRKLAKISKKQDTLTLVDPKGRCWPVKLFLKKVAPKMGAACTRVHIREGFDNFILNNILEVGDKCVFELEAGENMMQVKILKA